MAGVRQAVRHEEKPSTDLVITEETRRQFAMMVTAVPDAEGSGAERIVLSILNAKTWDELDDPWDSSKGEVFVDVEQRIDSIMRRPSTFADGLGVFLVVRGKRMDTDEEIVWTTGSVSVVAQLVKAFMLGALPLYATLRKAERPTERGYYPHHLEITGSGGNGTK